MAKITSKRYHYHGKNGRQVVRNMYIQNRIDGKLFWLVAGRWCPLCGFTQSEALAEKQLEALGV